MDEILSTLFEAIANLNQTQKDLTDELNGFEDAYSKDKELLQKQVDELTVQIDRLIKEAIAELPLAKDGENGIDGKDAEVDYEIVKDFILKTVEALPKAINGKDGLNGKDGEDGRDGLDGAKGLDGVDGKDGEDGKQGLKGDKGLDGEKGEDGLAIEDIYEKNGYIVVILTDGTKKELKLPAIEKHISTIRAGANDTTEIITTTADLSLTPKSQTILANAIGGVINITLPEPSICINSQRSYKIAITKIDLSTNRVNILPFASELIVNDASQYLVISEVINLITDGTNWYLGA